MVVDGEKVKFYIAAIAGMLKVPRKKLKNGGHIRSVLNVGRGDASFGAYLLCHSIIAMSLAPKDVHENLIQFALKRGILASLGVLCTILQQII
ncbi:probable methyltransferase PMT9 isoform X2 [Olea europaea subsp. europaea]|uniref:Methyltransferase n=1 Tax=Olea europaea subsp. europaea TaxID=158383 RepID=A0A8S0SBC9_OLEEU|nr:probable methyltransferase PMT9 isoform X2 [Olea europaea subsp. europaea]